MASTITISTTQEGWWDSTGTHIEGNLNYATGRADGLDHRSFFIFDLAGVTGTITGATLRLIEPASGYISPNRSETIVFYDVSTPAATLLAAGSGEIGIYNDLGTGVSYGSRSVSTADSGTIISQILSASALVAIQSALGGSFAIGGSLTLSAPLGREGIFFNTAESGPPVNQLVLTTTDEVPEPSSMLLLGTGLAVVVARRRFSKRK